ncbi:MAG: hypothetical protein ACK5LC_16795 [Coprobacillaceae bacterium]
MLKLLKYELIGSYRQFFMVFLCFIIGCIVIPFLPLDAKEVLGGFVIMATFGIGIAITVTIIMNFVKSMYGKPGYLTLTLPVSTKELVASKILGAVIWNIIGTIVLGIGMTIMILTIENMPIGEFFSGLGEFISKFGSYYVEFFQAIITMLVVLFATISSLYLVITFVQTKFIPKYKGLIGVVGYFGLMVLIELIFSWNPIYNFYSGLSQTGIIVFINAVCILGGVISYFGTVYFINHKIEVE